MSLSSYIDTLSSILQREGRVPSREEMSQLAAWFNQDLKREVWFDKSLPGWSDELAQDAAQRWLLSFHTKAKSGSNEERNDIECHAQRWTQWVFLVPEIIDALYSPLDDPSHPAVQEGLSLHCRLIERAARSVVFRQSAMLRQLSFDPAETADELWGMVMDELVRAMSDNFAHTWSIAQSDPNSFPTENTRGRKRGVMIRVALSADGTRLAAYRSDHHLSFWNIANTELIQWFDLSSICAQRLPGNDITSPVYLEFSRDGTQAAIEWPGLPVALIGSIGDPHSIRLFQDQERNDFLQRFTPAHPSGTSNDKSLPNLAKWNVDAITMQERLKHAFHWTAAQGQTVIGSASDQRRRMPDWMRKAGFEKAVYHIAKRRLVDLIRKETHTAFSSDASVKALAKQIEIDADVMDRLGAEDSGEWQDRHDFDKIITAMKQQSVQYKKLEIPCDRILLLKAEGLTNEAIGTQLGVPRGSVDYLWNQCKQRILEIFVIE